MKKLFPLAMALVLFFAGQAFALSIGFDFELGSTLYLEEGSSEPLDINLNIFNDSTETVDLSFYSGGFSANGALFENQVGQIYADYTLSPGETQTVLYRQFWASIFNWSTFSYSPAQVGDQMNFTSITLNGTMNGSFGSWGIAAEPGTNLYSIRVGDEPSSAPVPEPTTFLLLGSGLVGLAGLKRRQSKKAPKS